MSSIIMPEKLFLLLYFRLLPKCELTSNTNIPIEILHDLSRIGGISHERENWQIGGYVYSESDVKNQPLQQNLSSDQIDILQNAGDNLSQMNGPSAYLDGYSENKILYKKVIGGSAEIFEYSNNPTDRIIQCAVYF